MNKNSPYHGLEETQYKKKTEELVNAHPLKLCEIKNIALFCWDILWKTRIGENKTGINLKELDVPATVVGYFFEKLFAKELNRKYPDEWRGCIAKDQKDLVYNPNPYYSIEIKTSGQLGTKIYGNRSFNQKGIKKDDSERKDKSGFYITVNFFNQTITLIRFGWIDFSDWQPQKSPTGQMSGLPDYVYSFKLIEIQGKYRWESPIRLVPGIGDATAKKLISSGINNIKELLSYNGNDKNIIKLCNNAKSFLNSE